MWHREYVKWRGCAGAEFMRNPVWALWPWPWANIYALAWTVHSTSPRGPEGARESGSGGHGERGGRRKIKRKRSLMTEKIEKLRVMKAEPERWHNSPSSRIWSVNHRRTSSYSNFADQLQVDESFWHINTVFISWYKSAVAEFINQLASVLTQNINALSVSK